MMKIHLLLAPALAITAVVLLAPGAEAGHAWWHDDGVQATTFVFTPAQLTLSGNAVLHAACPSPEPAGSGACVIVGPGGEARASFNLLARGDNPEAGGDYLKIHARFGSLSTGWAECVINYNVGGQTGKLPDNRLCSGSGLHQHHRDDKQWRADSGAATIKCKNQHPQGGCKIVIYELQFEFGFWEFIPEFVVTEETTVVATDVCVVILIHGASSWYADLHARIDWGDGKADDVHSPGWDWSRYDPPQIRRCHSYTLSLVPFVILAEVSDGLGQRETHQHVTGRTDYDHESTCRMLGPWGSLQYSTCMMADPNDPVCSFQPGIYWEGDCHWARSDPVSWGAAAGTDLVNDGVTIARNEFNRWSWLHGQRL